MAKKKTINVQGNEISLITQGDEEYISLTDMAKGFEGEAGEYIRNWLRNNSTVRFLGVWEKVHNPNFNLVEFHQIKAELVDNTFLMSVKKWIARTSAIGMQARAGRYGGTYAHNEIALQFATWLSPEFHVYLVKEFKRLKQDEAIRLGLQFDLRRELTKTNYALQTDAIKAMLVPDKVKGTKDASPFYSNEADLLNVVVFGDTAKGWKTKNPTLKGNMRDHATIEQLMLLLNMEVLNATMIHWEWTQEMRLEVLHKESKRQMPTILRSAAMKRIKSNGKKKLKS